MESIKIWKVLTACLCLITCNAQIKNTKMVGINVLANLGICEGIIEMASYSNSMVKEGRNNGSQMAMLTYHMLQTDRDEILNHIALGGYISDQFLTLDEVHGQLPKCFQYDRGKKMEPGKVKAARHLYLANRDGKVNRLMGPSQETDQFETVFDTYFALKDALVKSDGNLVSVRSKELLDALNTVQMDKLSNEGRAVWLTERKKIVSDGERIEATKDVGRQRERFNTLSSSLYRLAKVSVQDATIYFQYCPMANDGKGAHWLSKENTIKNPYYGASMLSCGKTVEIIE